MIALINPEWPAPSHIKALTTLRTLTPPIQHSEKGYSQLKETLELPEAPIWVRQTHSTIALPAETKWQNHEADAIFSHKINKICLILTADCLPILLCDKKGNHVAAIHAGWRGLSKGIVTNTLKTLNLPGETLLAWLGPAISQAAFEVGDEVRDIFLSEHSHNEDAFIPSQNGRWLADLYALARKELQRYGVTSIFGGNYCTFRDQKLFFSYRREGSTTGRMASIIWISD